MRLKFVRQVEEKRGLHNPGRYMLKGRQRSPLRALVYYDNYSHFYLDEIKDIKLAQDGDCQNCVANYDGRYDVNNIV